MSSPYVLAIDPKTSGASLAWVYQDKDKTKDALIHLNKFRAPRTDEFDPASASRLAAAAAKKVVETALGKGGREPDLVVMSKMIPMDLKRDPSGPRRSAIWWETVRLFDEMGVPIAEIAPMSAQSMLSTFATAGKSGFEVTKKAVLDLYKDVPKDKDGYWYFTLALALAGAHILGWDTPMKVSYNNLKALRTIGTSLPSKITVPRDEAEWKRLNKAVYAAQEVAV